MTEMDRRMAPESIMDKMAVTDMVDKIYSGNIKGCAALRILFKWQLYAYFFISLNSSLSSSLSSCFISSIDEAIASLTMEAIMEG